MHELLVPDHPTAAQARARCQAFLARSWRPCPPVWRALPEARRTDLVPLLAWHALVRRTVRSAAHESALGTLVDELRATVESVYARRAECAIAVALQPVTGHHGLSALHFRAPLDELARAPWVHSFPSRHELLEHARRLAEGEARVLARVLGLEGERDELLAKNLALGLQLTDWLVHLDADFAAGRLNLAVEDLGKHRVELFALRDERSGSLGAVVAPVIADQVRWAREHLARGWPLCLELDRWQGRLLAFVLRWHAASLSALEARGFAPGPPPRAGWLRALACGTLSLATRAAPRWR